MVYGIIELINFAHGDVFMLGLFISLAWFTLLGVTKTLTGWQLRDDPAARLRRSRCSRTAALNVAIDRVAYRPLRRSTRLAPLITAIGVSFMLENIALLWKGPAPDRLSRRLPVGRHPARVVRGGLQHLHHHQGSARGRRHASR